MRHLLIFSLIILSNSCFAATSLFHSYITDLSPPYICRLKLKAATGVGLDPQHSYQFSGICAIKLPVGNAWVYQDVWVDLQANWDAQTNTANEETTITGLGTVSAQLKCVDDPFITKAQCSLIGYQNNTDFTNLGGVYNARMGQYPPFAIITGQHPPLARNQASLQEAILLSIKAARQEANAAHAAFNQSFPSEKTQDYVSSIAEKPVVRRTAKSACRLNSHKGQKRPKTNSHQGGGG